MTAAYLLDERTSRHPERVFLRTKDGDLTYRQVADGSSRLARGLAGLGIEAGEPTTMLMKNSADHVLSSFAIHRVGGVPVPINTALLGQPLLHQLQLSRSSVLLIDAELVPVVAPLLEEMSALRHVVVRGASRSEAVGTSSVSWWDFHELFGESPMTRAVTTDELAPGMMLFTSGTTGPSKACVLSHRYLLRQGSWHVKYLGLTADDVLYSPFPLFHIDSATLTVMAALQAGGTAAIGERFSASGFWQEVVAFEATVFNFMGATLSILWKQQGTGAEGQHRVRLAWGVPLPPWQQEFEKRFGFPLYEVYGLTDGGVVAYDPLDGSKRPGSCGRVIDEYEVAIGDDRGDLLPRGAVGEIVIRPREVGTTMSEYFGMPEETLRAFEGLWLHTGDLGRLDQGGSLYFLGRRKDSIRRRGENISAFEVEEIVAQHPDVVEVAAIGVPSDLTEEDVKVCVVLRNGAPLSPSELGEFCLQRAPAHMVPRYVEIVSSLPKTPTQKVEKFRLQERWMTGSTWDRQATMGESRAMERAKG